MRIIEIFDWNPQPGWRIQSGNWLVELPNGWAQLENGHDQWQEVRRLPTEEALAMLRPTTFTLQSPADGQPLWKLVRLQGNCNYQLRATRLGEGYVIQTDERWIHAICQMSDEWWSLRRCNRRNLSPGGDLVKRVPDGSGPARLEIRRYWSREAALYFAISAAKVWNSIGMVAAEVSESVASSSSTGKPDINGSCLGYVPQLTVLTKNDRFIEGRLVIDPCWNEPVGIETIEGQFVRCLDEGPSPALT